MKTTKTLFTLLSLVLLFLAKVSAQTPHLTLEQAVEMALKNYPAIRAAQAQKQSAEAGIELAHTSLLPRADLLWQENRATRNNVFGLLLPQSTLPSISGPQLDTATQSSAWGSAAGLLFSWEPFDFGLRKAGIELAKAQSKQAALAETLTQLDVAAAAADAFLTLLAAEQSVRAAEANVERAETFTKAVRVLVENQLRPGVDASRAEAELAAANNQLIQAQQTAELARANLADAVGQPGENIAIEAGPLLALPPTEPTLSVNLALHPLALAQTASIDAAKARDKVLQQTWFPRFNWQTAVYGRGTGARLDGTFRESRGFYPDTFNWATGMTITFPVMDFFGLRARRKAEAGNIAAEQARYDQVVNTLKTQDRRAGILIESARKIAANTEIQVKAARETLSRARVRYEYGLTNVVEVADAQRLQTQAEMEDAVARLAVWRALLVAARLQGDLLPFLKLTTRAK
ncbi:MAG TPA: TolC family protein [Blastocatellia bacterium]|nr:TolC family protein [Blastocatellia bacterium]HMX25297.1 TolC family protein [Blastocatellia bacterium]HNG28286.1 TolC family protein [Blastocatellia bacterium]